MQKSHKQIIAELHRSPEWKLTEALVRFLKRIIKEQAKLEKASKAIKEMEGTKNYDKRKFKAYLQVVARVAQRVDEAAKPLFKFSGKITNKEMKKKRQPVLDLITKNSKEFHMSQQRIAAIVKKLPH